MLGIFQHLLCPFSIESMRTEILHLRSSNLSSLPVAENVILTDLFSLKCVTQLQVDPRMFQGRVCDAGHMF